MVDLFEYSEVEIDEDEERYCVFCDANFLTSEFQEHHTSEFHVTNRIEKLEARNPDADTCGACMYLQVEEDVKFYCAIEFDSTLAEKGYLNVEIEDDGKHVPMQPTSCSVVSLWKTP